MCAEMRTSTTSMAKLWRGMGVTMNTPPFSSQLASSHLGQEASAHLVGEGRSLPSCQNVSASSGFISARRFRHKRDHHPWRHHHAGSDSRPAQRQGLAGHAMEEGMTDVLTLEAVGGTLGTPSGPHSRSGRRWWSKWCCRRASESARKRDNVECIDAGSHVCGPRLLLYGVGT